MPRLSAKELAALFKEWREDYAAAQREDAHGVAKLSIDTLRKTFDEKIKGPEEAEEAKDRDIER